MNLAPSLTIALNLRLEEVKQAQPTPPPVKPMYRVLHDIEMGGVRQVVLDRGVPLPEVNQLFPVHFTPLKYSLQYLWKDCNQLLTGNEWRKLAGCHRFATNNNGFDCSLGKHGPFADFVNGKDLGAELPKIESIICGGAIVTGVEAIERGERVLWLDYIDGSAGAQTPSDEWVLARRWLYYEAISVRPDGGTQSFSITSHPEYVPLIASQPVFYPLSKLTRVS